MATLEAKIRTETGSRKARKLRAGGLLPCTIYGHGKEPVSITMNLPDIDHAIHYSQRLLEIDLEGKVENVLLKDVQWDTFGQYLLHADLTRVNLDEKVTVTVPIVLRGTPAGASDNGVLRQSAADVSIECMVRDIPEEFRILVTDMGVGDTKVLGDLKLPAGATLIGDPSAPLCSVVIIEEEEEAVPEEGETTQPEVIGEKPDEGEDKGEEKEQSK